MGLPVIMVRAMRRIVATKKDFSNGEVLGATGGMLRGKAGRRARAAETGVGALRKKVSRDKYLLLMLLPCMVFLIAFKYIPMGGLVLAFRRFTVTKPFGDEWVGLWYFRMFFKSRNAWPVIRNTFMLNFYGVLFAFPAPIILALLMNEIRSQGFKKTTQIISYMPHFISVVVICSILHLGLSPSSGFINNLIRLFGIKPIYFLAEAGWFRTIYIGSGIWQEIGWGSIIYMAAIAGINEELYEAAVMDGAGRLQQTLRITLPCIKTTIIILLILRMGSMLASGTEKVLLLYNPLTFEKADVLGTYLYRVGLIAGNYSLGTAVGLANSVVSLLLIVGVNKIAKKYTEIGIW